MAKKSERVAKMRLLQIISVFILVAVTMIILIVFLAITSKYKTVFLPSTTINGVDVGDKTAEEAWQSFHDLLQDYSLTLNFRDGASETVDAGTIDYTYANKEDFEKLLDEQNEAGWMAAKFGRTYELTLQMDPVFDSDKLAAWVRSLPECQTENMTAPTDAALMKTDDDFVGIKAETYGTTFDPEELVSIVDEAVRSRLRTLDVDATGIYILPTIYSSDEDLNSQADYFNAFLNGGVVYQMPNGDVTLDRHTTINWITQPDGSFLVDTDAIQSKCVAFLSDLAKKNDTSKSTLVFHSTACGDITFDTAQYGFITNEGLEIAYLLRDLFGGTMVTREPAVFLDQAAPTVSDTYIEVDIRNQMAYYYIHNTLAWSTEIVTGDVALGRTTPLGIFNIEEKEQDVTLYGPQDADGNYSYITPVSYWMEFAAGYGLHDAYWRDKFGGTEYLENGSHGCVNLPPEKAEELYNNLEIGTQVFIFD